MDLTLILQYKALLYKNQENSVIGLFNF